MYAAYAEEGADFDALAKEQERLEAILAAGDAHTLENQLEVAADALRLPPWDAVVGKLSGGEKRRVALCRLRHALRETDSAPESFARGLLIAAGALTRPAAVIASGSMAYAYFAFHAGDGLSPLAHDGELSVLYCWVLLLFAFTGAGPVSVDAVIGRLRAGDQAEGKAPSDRADEKDAAESAV